MVARLTLIAQATAAGCHKKPDAQLVGRGRFLVVGICELALLVLFCTNGANLGIRNRFEAIVVDGVLAMGTVTEGA